MNVAIVYIGRDRQNQKLEDIARALAKGLSTQGHDCTVLNGWNDTDKRLTYFDYVVVGTESDGLLSAKIPSQVKQYLRISGAAGKRSLGFIIKTLRSGKTLSNLMKAMESEGMMLNCSDIIRNTRDAESVGKHISINRN